MKRKLGVAAAVCVAAFFVNVYFSTIVHELMNKSFGGISSLSFARCVKSIMENKNHAVIFLSIQIFVMLGMCLLLVKRFGDFTSNMVKVTPDIKTPVPAGQKQHGSARWQTKKEIHGNFDTARLEKDDALIKSLIEHGYDDLEFMKQKGGDGM